MVVAIQTWQAIEETAEKQDAASKSSDTHRKETCEGSKGGCACQWLVWSMNCIMMSMYLYISSTYQYVLVCTERCSKVERRHIDDVGLWQMKLGVLNKYMVVLKQTNAAWVPRIVHVFQPVHTSMYLVCTGYIPVCTWITKILLRILCFYFWQWEKIMCVRDRYVVMFKN